MGKTFLDALVAHCRTDDGYTVLTSVVTKAKGDLMPSYFLAETLKYLYLLFAPDDAVDLDQRGVQHRGAPAPADLVADQSALESAAARRARAGRSVARAWIPVQERGSR